MKASIAAALGATLIALSLPATASVELAQKNACIACHAAERKIVGPSYKEIAAKYANDRDAVNKLAASIRAGGAGRWGPVPMPAQPNLSEEDAKKLAAWVLAGGK